LAAAQPGQEHDRRAALGDCVESGGSETLGPNINRQQQASSETGLIAVPEKSSAAVELEELFKRDPAFRSVGERCAEDDLDGRKELQRQIVSIVGVWIGFIVIGTLAQCVARFFSRDFKR